MLQIGPYSIGNPTVLAPMAGVTDLPFRELCRKLGAGMTVSEMVTADSRLWNSRKSSQRLRHDDEATPRSVQIVGNNPAIMADAAQKTVALGAEIIDINMGCPAKKVCKQAAGSALLKNEKLVSHILCAVVEAVDVPVTLKIRTGWSPEHRNATTIGRIAEDAGIAALAVHGRTRSCRFHGTAEYDTIAEVVDTVNIPVIANGDITSPQQARQILKHTGASAVMLGRGAQGNPWLFREINHHLSSGNILPPPDQQEVAETMIQHLCQLHHFYGDILGPRIARKHVGWYVAHWGYGEDFRRSFNQLATAEQQLQQLQLFFRQRTTIDSDLFSSNFRGQAA